MNIGAVTYYYNADGLGSINVLNDSPGTVQDKYVFDAWGTTKSQTTPVANSFTYTARETAEAGLMYYRARYYGPSIGKFVSEDPIRWVYANPSVPNGLKATLAAPIYFHNYVYATNTPSRITDPSGLWIWKLILVAVGYDIVKFCTLASQACHEVSTKCQQDFQQYCLTDKSGGPPNGTVGTNQISCYTEFKTCRIESYCITIIRPIWALKDIFIP